MLNSTLTRLHELEAVIERGIQTYIEVGKALDEIREQRLYEGYSTFEEYCRERWGFARQTAYNYLKAAAVAQNVPMSVQIPQSQAVELASLEPNHQREVAEAVEAAGRTFEEIPVREVREIVREVKAGTPPAMAVHFSSESEEWYTPPEVVAMAVLALGGIDLDPCSNAGKTIPATRHFTQEDDGLSKPWSGNVYMNPPYGRGIVEWVKKLCEEYARGNVAAAIALVPGRIDTDWFRMFDNFPVCCIDGRLKFSGHENSAPFPSVVVYLGKDLDGFYAAFGDMGNIRVSYEPFRV